MMRGRPTNQLDRPVDRAYDHTLGPANAPVTLVEYGSYACPYCQAANEQIAAVRDEFGERYAMYSVIDPSQITIWRVGPPSLPSCAGRDQFWKAHVELMTRSETLTEDDLRAVAEDLGLPRHRACRAGTRRPLSARGRASMQTSAARRRVASRSCLRSSLTGAVTMARGTRAHYPTLCAERWAIACVPQR